MNNSTRSLDKKAAVSAPPGKPLSRRGFIAGAALGAAGLTLGPRGGAASPEPGEEAAPPLVAFNTANLVARVTGYRFQLSQWGGQHEKTVAATDEAAWRAICAEISAAGFRAVEVWEAHASPDVLDEGKARTWKAILADHGLKPVAYAGGLRREILQLCQWLGIPHVDGGLHGLHPDEATKLCEAMGIGFNLENHPEKNAGEIRAKIGGGNRWLGVCIDTGWLATQSAPVPETITALGPLVRHNHIKDVKHQGGHETCLLGEGVARVEVCLEAFRATGYQGVYSWEDEPEDRNPFDSAKRNRKWLEARVG